MFTNLMEIIHGVSWAEREDSGTQSRYLLAALLVWALSLSVGPELEVRFMPQTVWFPKSVSLESCQVLRRGYGCRGEISQSPGSSFVPGAPFPHPKA